MTRFKKIDDMENSIDELRNKYKKLGNVLKATPRDKTNEVYKSTMSDFVKTRSKLIKINATI